jgi:TatA/E family protein of Tat protein translocase
MFDLVKNIGSTELIIILLVLVILFGANTISDMAKRGGETLKEVKKIKKDIIEATKDDPANS